MKKEIILFLTAFGANLATGNNDMSDTKIKDTLRNYFDAIATNKTEEKNHLSETLRTEERTQQQVFNLANEERRQAKLRNFLRRKNMYSKRGSATVNIVKRQSSNNLDDPTVQIHNNGSYDSTTEKHLPYATPSREKFLNHLETGGPDSAYNWLIEEYSNTFANFENRTAEEKTKYEDLQRKMRKKLFPLRMCCEPQFLRYYINYAKELSGVRVVSVLFFLDGHRREWIEKLNQNKGQHNFAGRLEQGIARLNMSVEQFVNETEVIDMRASTAIHGYLSRAIRPMTPREKFAVNRFTLTRPHGNMFNTLAAAMKTPPITVTYDGIVKIDVCNEILDLESDEMKITFGNLYQ